MANMNNTVECGFHKPGDICNIVNHRIINSITEKIHDVE